MTEIQWSDGVLLRPRGDLIEGLACDGLERTLGRALERGQGVIVCLSETGQLTARALGVLAYARAMANETGGRITLCCPRPHHRWLLERTGLSSALGVHDSEAEARAAVVRIVPGGARSSRVRSIHTNQTTRNQETRPTVASAVTPGGCGPVTSP